MARVTLNSKKLSKCLWAEAVNTACHTINRVYFRLGTKKIPYELWKGRKADVSYFHVSGSLCCILNDREHWGKFNANDFSEFSEEELISNLINDADEDQTIAIFEKLSAGPSDCVAIETGTIDPIVTETDQAVSSRKTKDGSKDVLTDPIRKEPSSRVKKNHPSELILGDPNGGMVTRTRYVNHVKYSILYLCVSLKM